MTDPAMKFSGPALRRARYLVGLTQAQAALRIETTTLTVASWEKGIHNPSARFVPKILAAYNCTLDDLLEVASNAG